MSPVNMSSSTLASKGPSRCAPRNRATRLLIGCIVVVVHGFRGLLARKPIVENLPCDRRGGACAEAGVLHDYRDRDLRLVRGRVRNEERVVAIALRNLAFDV